MGGRRRVIEDSPGVTEPLTKATTQTAAGKSQLGDQAKTVEEVLSQSIRECEINQSVSPASKLFKFVESLKRSATRAEHVESLEKLIKQGIAQSQSKVLEQDDL